jgi:putative copper resistance protein D
VLLSAAFVALISGIIWFLFTAANMAGDLSGATDRDTLSLVLTDTGFGLVWAARLALAVFILGMLAVRAAAPALHPDRLLAALCATLAASLAGVGHTQVQEGLARIIHVGADGAHLLAAGAWLGAFPPLLYLVTTAARPDDRVMTGNALMRFSKVGQLVVVTLIISGLINSWYLVGSFDLLNTPYGRLLLIKLCLFAAMLGLAALNRFWLVPALAGKGALGETTALLRLRRHILGEQILGVLVILVVSLLGMSEPSAGA